MHLTPLDIQQKKFSPKFKGYDKDEVDGFLTLVSSELEAVNTSVVQMRDEVERQRRIIDSFEQRESALTETMITAQKVTEDIKESAKKEADIIIGRAELDAERLVEDAQDRLTELFSDIQELKRQKTLFISQLRGLLKTHEKLIEIDEEEQKKPSARAAAATANDAAKQASAAQTTANKVAAIRSPEGESPLFQRKA